MKNVCLIGVGNIGSRHLQGLKRVNFPLSVEVVDPSVDSLNIAKERYDQIPEGINHQISYLQNIKEVSESIDLAIISTSSNVRRKVLEDLFSHSTIKYLMLEKILFQKRGDYFDIEELLNKKGCKAWVNFSMRSMPFYYTLKERNKGPVQMTVSGSQYGLITNAIHYIDYIAFLTNCYNFRVDTGALDRTIIKSKRVGFLEINGTLSVHFKDGSVGLFTCYESGEAPYLIEIFSKDFRCISKENERKAWISSAQNNWGWQEVDSNIPYQSEMTNVVVEDILKNGKCFLTAYKIASAIHLQLLESLLQFLNESGKKFSFYPFT